MKRLSALAALSFFLPPFAACVMPMSSQEIHEANMRHVQRMCGDPNYAYETGYNHGLERKRLDTSWVDTSCMPEWRQQVRASYQQGYTSGMEHAPVVVRGVGGGGGVRVYSSTETCRFSSDCGEDRSCRPDNSGTKVCMGGGYAGDPCWFSSECVSNSCDVAAKTCR